MRKYKVGFFKKPQGVFTLDVIKSIENKLRTHKNIELFSGLDFSKAYVKNGRAYLGDFDLNTLDIYFWHDTVKPADWKGDNYFLNILKILENNCLVVNSSESTKITNDKFLAHTVLKNNQLPIVDFALVNSEDKDTLSKIFSNFGESILIKPRFGGWGTGIIKIESLDQLFSSVELINSFSSEKKQIFIEKYYPNDISKWISVVVFGNKVLFGYRKKLLGTSQWKIYDPNKIDSKGIYSLYINPSQELKNTALLAKNAIGKDIIGFDFIFTDQGYKIVDENGRPGLYKQCLEKSGVNIEDQVINLIFSKIKLLK
jgi:glutathione synthase/RimK-type ligase-like ATP-grasp enzyme